LLTVLLYAGLLATGSRGGILAALVAVLVLLWTNRAAIEWRGLKPLGFAMLGVSLFLPFLSNRGLWPGYLALTDGGNPSVIDRLSLWEAAWKMMMDHPWT